LANQETFSTLSGSGETVFFCNRGEYSYFADQSLG